MMVNIQMLLAETNSFDIGNFLQNSTNTIKTWGGYLIVLIGVIMIIAAVYQAAKGLISPQKSQTNWGLVLVLLILGGAFSVGGYTWVAGIAEGGKTTIDDLGKGSTIIPMLTSFIKF